MDNLKQGVVGIFVVLFALGLFGIDLFVYGPRALVRYIRIQRCRNSSAYTRNLRVR